MSEAPARRSATLKDLRIFGALLIAFSGFLALLAFRGDAQTAALWILAVGGLTGLTGLVLPGRIRLLYTVWMGVVHPIGLLVSSILMAAVFFLIVTPMGLLRRLFGDDPMTPSFDRSAASYWEPRKAPDGLKRYFRQY